MAMLNVTGELSEQTANDAAHQQNWDEYATSEVLIESTVNPISPGAAEGWLPPEARPSRRAG